MLVLDLFSGIGGFSLGLERAGMKTVAFCEIEPYCRAVLRKHWPDVPIYDDVRTLTAARLATDGIMFSNGRTPDRLGYYRGIDLICGGFPCQDISVAGKGAGIEGERSGLWSEYARIIGEVRPRYVIVENVAALLGRGLSRVLGDLASLGFDAEWHCIPASAVGAPHRRDRLWIVAYSGSEQHEGDCASNEWTAATEFYAADAYETRRPDFKRLTTAATIGSGWITASLANRLGDADNDWRVEPDVGRVAHGVPARVDRLRSLGNAVVPQIPEIIGKAIMAQCQT